MNEGRLSPVSVKDVDALDKHGIAMLSVVPFVTLQRSLVGAFGGTVQNADLADAGLFIVYIGVCSQPGHCIIFQVYPCRFIGEGNLRLSRVTKRTARTKIVLRALEVREPFQKSNRSFSSSMTFGAKWQRLNPVVGSRKSFVIEQQDG